MPKPPLLPSFTTTGHIPKRCRTCQYVSYCTQHPHTCSSLHSLKTALDTKPSAAPDDTARII
jgi:hypothetical protein